MLGTAQLLAISCVLGFTDVELGVRSEGTTRTLAVEGSVPESHLDLTLSPRAALLTESRRLRLSANYSPNLIWVDATAGQGPNWVHNAGLATIWQANADWRISGSANASYGTVDFLAVPQTTVLPGQSLQVVPTLSKLRYGHADASAGAAGALRRDVRTTLSATCSIDGGADDESRRSLPLLRVVSFSGALHWNLTQTGVLVPSAAASSSELGSGRRATIGSASVSWHERPSPEVEWWVGAGGGYHYEDGGGLPSGSGVLPEGEVGFHHATVVQAEEPGSLPQVPQTQRLEQTIVLHATPAFDRLSADVSTLVEARANVAWALGERWILEGTGSGGIIPRSGEELASVVALESRVGWRPGKLEIWGGLRGVYQRDPRVSDRAIRQWGIFLGVGFVDVERL